MSRFAFLLPKLFYTLTLSLSLNQPDPLSSGLASYFTEKIEAIRGKLLHLSATSSIKLPSFVLSLLLFQCISGY